MQIAPFLISKSKRSGYRVVVAPSFLSSATANDLASWVGSDPDDNASVYRRTVKGTPDGDLTFFFRANQAPGKSDAQGRPIIRFEGICIPSREAENFIFNRSYLEAAERANDGLFAEFCDWPADHAIVSTAERLAYVPGLKADGSKLVVEERLATHPRVDERPAARAGISKEPLSPGANRQPKKNGDPGILLVAPVAEPRSEKPKVERTVFRSVAAVALGCTGVAVAANGVWGVKSDKSNDQRQANWKRLFIRMGEIGLGIGLTWAAFVVGRAGLATVRR